MSEDAVATWGDVRRVWDTFAHGPLKCEDYIY
jgi:hypothetical protein